MWGRVVLPNRPGSPQIQVLGSHHVASLTRGLRNGVVGTAKGQAFGRVTSTWRCGPTRKRSIFAELSP